jgi:hypothetical protein
VDTAFLCQLLLGSAVRYNTEVGYVSFMTLRACGMGSFSISASACALSLCLLLVGDTLSVWNGWRRGFPLYNFVFIILILVHLIGLPRFDE